MADSKASSATRLLRFTQLGLGYTLAVIVWGAYVRATGSGAGCGEHWPLCNGEVLPRAPAAQTLIELTHRVTSGLALLFTVVLPVWAFRAHPSGHPMRRGSLAVLALMVLEGGIGAGLVLFRLVAENASMARAYAMSAHLVNTFLLLGALTLTLGYAAGERRPRFFGHGLLSWSFGAAALGMMVLGVSGAVTALGDTLYPATSLAEGLSPTAHLFLKLRLFHPLLAVLIGGVVVAAGWIAQFARPSVRQRRWAVGLTGLYAAQLAAGLINVALLAPVWMQLVHLLLADAVWIALVRAGAIAMAAPADEPETSPAPLVPAP